MDASARSSRSRPLPLAVAMNPAKPSARGKAGCSATEPASKLLKHCSRSASSLCVMPPSPVASSTVQPPPATITSSERPRSLTPTADIAKSSGFKYCSSLRCASSMISSNAVKPSSTPTVATSTAATAATTSSTTDAHAASMSAETYFRLLKKSQVLEHLLQLSSHAGESEQQVRRLQCDQARAQCVQTRVFAELERSRRQVVDAQQHFLELLEALTAIEMRDERLQGREQLSEAVSAEERTLLDLQRASTTSSRPAGSPASLETQALAAVGRQRVQQLQALCERYERQLVGSEAALSQAIHSSTARESAARIAQLEARNAQHEAHNRTLETQLELARGQLASVQDQLKLEQERRTQGEHEKQQLVLELGQHTTATQQFATDLQLELRRRYGVVPSVLELKWRHYFPWAPRPSQ